MGETRFFPELSLGYFIHKSKMQLTYAKLERSYDQFSRKPVATLVSYVFFFRKYRFGVLEIYSPAHFGPFLVQICPFQAQNQHFGLYLLNGSLNFADFWYRNLSYDLLLKNCCLQSGKNLALSILGILVKICPFQAQNQHFGLYLSNGSLNFADFWYRNLSYGLLLEN